MKFFKSLVLLACTFVLAAPVMASDSFTIWNSEEFTGPFTDGVIATSNTINNTNGVNAIKVHVVYEDIVHNGQYENVCACDIRVVLEEEIASDVWIPVASQFSEYRILDSSPQRVVLLTPTPVFNDGSDDLIGLADGSSMKVSRTQGQAPESFRIRLTVNEFAPNALTSIRISAHGRKFNE